MVLNWFGKLMPTFIAVRLVKTLASEKLITIDGREYNAYPFYDDECLLIAKTKLTKWKCNECFKPMKVNKQDNFEHVSKLDAKRCKKNRLEHGDYY